MLQRIRQLGRDFAFLARPYWRSEERWIARWLLAGIVVLNLIVVGTSIMFTIWQGAFFNSLEQRNWSDLIALLFWWRYSPTEGFAPSFTLTAAIFVPATVYSNYLLQALQIRWRKWHTENSTGRWLEGRTYYLIELQRRDTDNPDQRISEDIRMFVEHSLALGVGLLSSVVTLISYFAVLWALSGPIQLFGPAVPGSLVWVAFGYAIVGTVLTHIIGRHLIDAQFQQQRVEADFRFSLMRVRENAEGIAFHEGEAAEQKYFQERFTSITGNWRDIMNRTRNLAFLTAILGQFALVFPLALVAPAYFAGSIALGGIFQTSNAFFQTQNALSWIVVNYPRITEWAATVERLAKFERTVAAMRSETAGPMLAPSSDSAMRSTDLQLALPNGGTLLTKADFEIPKGDRLLLTGPSGAGKSTLLRALVGIWPFGSGRIERPAGKRLFLPQNPYLPVGPLKRSLCYPMPEEGFSDDAVLEVLGKVDLGHLAGELALTDEWSKRLSRGEQQRIAFARVLLIRPDWIFLDEATASLDAASERRLYELIAAELPKASAVSVAHRAEVAGYCNRQACLHQNELRWSVAKAPA